MINSDELKMPDCNLFNVILSSKSIFKGLNLDFQSFRGVLEQQEVSLPSKNINHSVKIQNVNRCLTRRVIQDPSHFIYKKQRSDTNAIKGSSSVSEFLTVSSLCVHPGHDDRPGSSCRRAGVRGRARDQRDGPGGRGGHLQVNVCGRKVSCCSNEMIRRTISCSSKPCS